MQKWEGLDYAGRRVKMDAIAKWVYRRPVPEPEEDGYVVASDVDTSAARWELIGQ